MNQRKIRLSQTLSPFGVGAIYDYLGESLVACDISLWKGAGRRISAPRLERALRVSGLRVAPVVKDNRGLPFMRFPSWLFCPSCRRMVRWSTRDEGSGAPSVCRGCGSKAQLVPMRFVVACRNGHMSDVPWEDWAHLGAVSPAQKQCRSQKLRFLNLAKGSGGLDSLVVRCDTCKAQHDLSGLTGPDSMKRIGFACTGRQPWQLSDSRGGCSSVPQVVQRGASNLYFARTVSAIVIPPESQYDPYGDLAVLITNSPYWGALASGGPNSPLASQLISMIAHECHCDEAAVLRVLADETAREDGRTDTGSAEADERGPEALKDEEWLALNNPPREHHDLDQFVARPASLTDSADRSPVLTELQELVDRVVVVTKLREVRALVGFSRYEPDALVTSPDLGKGLGWLPALEVLGEGVFLSLNEDAVRSWESLFEVVARAAILESKRADSMYAARLPVVTPRFLLLHTLSHLLIRQLTFKCGYAAASLRERIYSKSAETGEAQAGILIYTAAGDSEGTLGGLSRQGEPPRLVHSLIGALETGGWCSSDPICAESPGQGYGALNLAACHACTLISETSCEFSNSLLDRSLVVGSASFRHGFFRAALDAALIEAVGD